MKDLLPLAQKLSGQPYLGEVASVDPLEQDVSPRNYYRVNYKSGEFRTAILMELADGFGPMGGGVKKLTQGDAFVEVGALFRNSGIRVPQLFCDARSEGYLLLEDFGSAPLWKTLSEIKENLSDPLIGKEAHKRWDTLTSRMIPLVLQIQSLPAEGESVIYERKPTFEQLYAGAKEIVDFILIPLGIKDSEQDVSLEFASQLAEEVLSHPKVVSHYDLMSHNIHVLDDDMLGVIDFQDASLESPVRDLHALLCDRGMDLILGEETSQKLFQQYFDEQNDPTRSRELYFEYAVHWDMRVSGRFTKLSEQDGRKKYGQWIDGTLARVLKNAPQLFSKFERAGDFIEILQKRLGEERLEIIKAI